MSWPRVAHDAARPPAHVDSIAGQAYKAYEGFSRQIVVETGHTKETDWGNGQGGSEERSSPVGGVSEGGGGHVLP